MVEWNPLKMKGCGGWARPGWDGALLSAGLGSPPSASPGVPQKRGGTRPTPALAALRAPQPPPAYVTFPKADPEERKEPSWR